MNNTTIRPWNWDSEVRVCGTCDGMGVVPSHRRPSVDDPYPEDPCPDCDGEHLPECQVCGFEHEVKGYDCFVCDMVAALSDGEFSAIRDDDLIAAIARAMDERRKG